MTESGHASLCALAADLALNAYGTFEIGHPLHYSGHMPLKCSCKLEYSVAGSPKSRPLRLINHRQATADKLKRRGILILVVVGQRSRAPVESMRDHEIS
jgi:hypothetical protein